jgi:hypothetical protein
VDTDPSGTVVVGNATTVDVIDRAEEVPSTAGEGGESTPSPSTAPTPSVTDEDVDLDDLAERADVALGALVQAFAINFDPVPGFARQDGLTVLDRDAIEKRL